MDLTPSEPARMDPGEFNQLVDALIHGTATVASAARQYPQLHLRRGNLDETLLHFFAVESEPELVRALASLGSDLNAENEFGNTPLMEALILNHLPMVQLLLELGANPNWQSSRGKNTALHVAADYGLKDAVPVLLRFGANPEIPNEHSETPADIIVNRQLPP